MPGQEDKQGSAEGRVVAGEEEGGGVGGERKGRTARYRGRRLGSGGGNEIGDRKQLLIFISSVN